MDATISNITMRADLDNFEAELNESKRQMLDTSAAESDYSVDDDDVVLFGGGKTDFYSSAYFEESLRILEADIEVNNSPLSVTSLEQYKKQNYLRFDSVEGMNGVYPTEIGDVKFDESISNFFSPLKEIEKKSVSRIGSSVLVPPCFERTFSEGQPILELDEDHSESTSGSQSTAAQEKDSTIFHISSGGCSEAVNDDLVDGDDSIDLLEQDDLLFPLKTSRKIAKEDPLHTSLVSMTGYDSCRSCSIFDSDHDASVKLIEARMGMDDSISNFHSPLKGNEKMFVSSTPEMGMDESFSNFHSPMKDHDNKFTSLKPASVPIAPWLEHDVSENAPIVELYDDNSEADSLSSSQAEMAMKADELLRAIGSFSYASLPSSSDLRTKDDDSDTNGSDNSLHLAEIDDFVLPLQDTRHSTMTSTTGYESVTSNDLDVSGTDRPTTPRVKVPIDANASMVNFFSPSSYQVAAPFFGKKATEKLILDLDTDGSESSSDDDVDSDSSSSDDDEDSGSSSSDEDSDDTSDTNSIPMTINKTKVMSGVHDNSSLNYGPPPLEESTSFAFFRPIGSLLNNIGIGFSTPPSELRMKDLHRLKILGEGQFGQVWLVSDKRRRAYALKLFAKYDLIQSGEVDMIIHEKEIHQQIHEHPFIVRLVSAFQDEKMIYMVQDFAQGGELFSVIEHYANMKNGGMPEYQAKFYTLCIADAISHMHSMQVAYRDLKPENCMIDKHGYPLLIDFGYAKYVPHKTYTFCGTPRFLPPEAVYPENGYDCIVDHWALGVLIYEMLTGGVNPFYYDGISELELFTAIQEEDYLPLPEKISFEAVEIVAGLLTKDPSLRLGSSECGTNEILQHAWLRELDLIDMRKRKTTAPWVPETRDALDTSCFDQWDHIEDKFSANHPRLSRQQDLRFQSFKY